MAESGHLVDRLSHVGVPERLLCGAKMNRGTFIKQCPQDQHLEKELASGRGGS